MLAADLTDRDPIQISELQHFAFCRRQWALIHIEGQWQENSRTVEGDILHRRAHDAEQFESRGELFIARGLRVGSRALNLTGVCDVVEFRRDARGITLAGREGQWKPYPIEYKRGEPKTNDIDEVQLCAQTLCLEETLVCDIPEGSLYYGETKRRVSVKFSAELRGRVSALISELSDYARRGHTPKAAPTKGCNACSLKEVCLPKLVKTPSVESYIRLHMTEELP